MLSPWCAVPASIPAAGIANVGNRMVAVVGAVRATQPWIWETAGAVALSLLLLNVVLVVALALGRVRRHARERRERQFRVRLEEILAELSAQTSRGDPGWVRGQISRLGELHRPIVALAVIERMRPASEEEREHTLRVLREAGGVDLLVRASRGRVPWRRAGAISALGWIGAAETVPLMVERLTDRNRSVRESAARALGQIGEPCGLQPLGELFRAPGAVGEGVVYDALIGFGAEAEPVFTGALRSPIESVRVASCFGVATVSEPAAARSLLEPLLDDDAPVVRAAAAESLAQLGGELIPDALARASRDEQAGVRSAASSALGSYDDPRAVALALGSLVDPDRETAVRAAEALVRLSLRPAAGPAAGGALEDEAGAWPVERALVFTRIGKAEE
jgi:HEAT repeat protein